MMWQTSNLRMECVQHSTSRGKSCYIYIYRHWQPVQPRYLYTLRWDTVKTTSLRTLIVLLIRTRFVQMRKTLESRCTHIIESLTNRRRIFTLSCKHVTHFGMLEANPLHYYIYSHRLTAVCIYIYIVYSNEGSWRWNYLCYKTDCMRTPKRGTKQANQISRGKFRRKGCEKGLK